ncbi:MAG: 30S ribosomal protein S12 methylthiotransferase RimO [Candidatus Kapabacteria bacterium]|jgi:ribosomal protein S12 methylthiotransferase|nr:30S ribosomal protein S12 methylthiotransferase RimO [Candidatus Kapabacteria bacterium]
MNKSKNNNINKISVITLGCAKNLVDSERFSGLLLANGFEFTDADNADAMVINTCGFIKSAKEENVQIILEAAEQRRKGKLKKLIVTGCLSERYNKELTSQIPNVDFFLGINSDKKILKILSGDHKYTLTGERMLFTPKHYAYLKISEGCNQKCSFCAIPLMRGKHITEPEDKMVSEAVGLAERGTKELVLIAQDSTYYGKDSTKKQTLAKLLERLSGIEKLEWIRLMYAYPRQFPHEILDVIANHPKLCNYIDMPMQHASDNVLREMKRGIKLRKMEALLDTIREKIPNVTLRSTFIVGFPNESDADFQTLLDFIERQQLDRVGVFTYSHEEGTSAFPLGDPIPEKVKEERRGELMLLQQKISLKKNKAKIGRQIKVMVDGTNDKGYFGRSEQDAPDVDNLIYFNSKSVLKPGEFVNVMISKAEEYDLFGTHI